MRCILYSCLTAVSSLPLGLVALKYTSTGVNDRSSLHDETILHELSNVLSAIGGSNGSDLSRVKPDLALSTSEYGCC
jgi:hypothetical protein